MQIMAKPLRELDAAQHFKLLHRALDNHNRHLAVTDLTVRSLLGTLARRGPDPCAIKQGKFVALSNAGLTLTAMEDFDNVCGGASGIWVRARVCLMRGHGRGGRRQNTRTLCWSTQIK